MIRYLLRLLKLTRVWIQYDLDQILLELPWLKPIRWLMYLNPIRWIRPQKLTRGERLCRALEALGPIYVKCGQLLSTRRDILPLDIAEAFEKLQDRVKPFSSEMAQERIESSLKQPISTLFQTFETTPLASASIAQVHRATLPTGEAVVVKVLRPDILSTLEDDFAILYTLARIAQRFKAFKPLKPVGVVKEIEQTLRSELDLLREASNASVLKRHIEKSSISTVKIPRIHWSYCTSDIMVMEEMTGIRLSQLSLLKSMASEQTLKNLAEQLVSLFYEQVFSYNFFHADMHPGNIFVDLKDPEHPVIQLVDFGIMGSLSQADKDYLAQNFMAFFKRDYRRVSELHLESGWVPAGTRVEQFEDALRAVCEPLFERNRREISGAQTLIRLFQVARRFEMEVMPQLLLLQKTLLNVEGIARSLYPDLDLWGVARPVLESFMHQQMGTKAMLKHLTDRVIQQISRRIWPWIRKWL